MLRSSTAATALSAAGGDTSDYGSQWHGTGVTREVEGCAALAAIDRAWPRLVAPFFAGFFAISRRS
jgi:hypothetical protein